MQASRAKRKIAARSARRPQPRVEPRPLVIWSVQQSYSKLNCQSPHISLQKPLAKFGCEFQLYSLALMYLGRALSSMWLSDPPSRYPMSPA